MATKFLSSYSFPTALEREIWELHTDGKSLRDISIELHKKGHRFFKDKIHHIIKHLEAVMRGLDSPYQKKIEGQLTFDIFFKGGKNE